MAKDKSNSLTPLTQAELDEIIGKHEGFKDGRANGARAVLQHYDLSGLSFKGHDLSNADFTSSVMVETIFEQTNLSYSIFYACDLRKANFQNANMTRADLRGACLRGAVMTNATLVEADLREGSYATFDPEKGLTFTSDSEVWKEGIGGVDMRGANLGSVKLSGAVAINSNFEDADLSKSIITKGNLSGANLTGANLAGADLSQCELKDVKLNGANLTGVMMDFSNLVNVDMEGALTDQAAGHTLETHKLSLEEMIASHQLWLKTQGGEGKKMDLSDHDLRSGPSLVGANLTMLIAERSIWYGRDLSQINLQAAMVRGGDFRHCTFTTADLRGTNFSKCRMVGATFSKAHLEPLYFDGKRSLKTSFAGANLRYSDFTGAILRDVDFTGADLSSTNFTDADTRGANFAKAILKDAKLRTE